MPALRARITGFSDSDHRIMGPEIALLGEGGIPQMEPKTKSQILVVDNDDQERAELADKLKMLGHNSAETWSGSEALRLLKSKRFDVLLVEDYLADMYIGDFLERVSALNDAPKIWVMRAMPVEYTSTFGSRSYPVVAKKHLEKLFSQVNGGNSGPSEVNNWKH
jgi:CheY-like chemotaxis protein